nr:MAG TPA: hypothetical protein [Caudoviricetes sp.]
MRISSAISKAFFIFFFLRLFCIVCFRCYYNTTLALHCK